MFPFFLHILSDFRLFTEFPNSYSVFKALFRFLVNSQTHIPFFLKALFCFLVSSQTHIPFFLKVLFRFFDEFPNSYPLWGSFRCIWFYISYVARALFPSFEPHIKPGWTSFDFSWHPTFMCIEIYSPIRNVSSTAIGSGKGFKILPI